LRSVLRDARSHAPLRWEHDCTDGPGGEGCRVWQSYGLFSQLFKRRCILLVDSVVSDGCQAIRITAGPGTLMAGLSPISGHLERVVLLLPWGGVKRSSQKKQPGRFASCNKRFLRRG